MSFAPSSLRVSPEHSTVIMWKYFTGALIHPHCTGAAKALALWHQPGVFLYSIFNYKQHYPGGLTKSAASSCLNSNAMWLLECNSFNFSLMKLKVWRKLWRTVTYLGGTPKTCSSTVKDWGELQITIRVISSACRSPVCFQWEPGVT